MTSLLAPLLVTLSIIGLFPRMAGRVRPAHGARLLALTITAVLVCTWATATSLALATVAHHQWTVGLLAWCHDAFSVNHIPPWPVGAASLIVSIALTGKMLAVAVAWRRTAGADADHVRIIESERAVAYAEPGRRGGVVVTTAMLNALAPAERRALLAHERAHLRHHHDWHLALAALTDPIPGVRRIGDELRLLLERWADEEAARVVGDRAVVASAIARAALHSPPRPSLAMAATGGDVRSRVQALLEPTAAGRWSNLAGLVAAVTAMATTATQLHHLLAVVDTLCHQ